MSIEREIHAERGSIFAAGKHFGVLSLAQSPDPPLNGLLTLDLSVGTAYLKNHTDGKPLI